MAHCLQQSTDVCEMLRLAGLQIRYTNVEINALICCHIKDEDKASPTSGL